MWEIVQKAPPPPKKKKTQKFQISMHFFKLMKHILETFLRLGANPTLIDHSGSEPFKSIEHFLLCSMKLMKPTTLCHMWFKFEPQLKYTGAKSW